MVKDKFLRILYLQMALPEITLKDLKKKTSLTLSLQSERDQFIDTLGQRIDNLPSNVNNPSSKLARVESSLAVNKQLIMNYYNALLHLRGVSIAKTIRQKRLFGGCRYTIICWRQQLAIHCLQHLGRYRQVCVCVCVCVCMCMYCAQVCVCVYVFTSIHREGFICLDQLEYQGTDQRCYVEDINFLCQVPSSQLQNASIVDTGRNLIYVLCIRGHQTFLTSHAILFTRQKRAKPRLNQCASGFQNMGPSATISRHIAFGPRNIVSRSASGCSIQFILQSDTSIQFVKQSDTTYFSSSDWFTLDFLLMTSPTCCNLPRKYTPVKYKARQKAWFPIVIQTTSQHSQEWSQSNQERLR